MCSVWFLHVQRFSRKTWINVAINCKPRQHYSDYTILGTCVHNTTIYYIQWNIVYYNILQYTITYYNVLCGTQTFDSTSVYIEITSK